MPSVFTDKPLRICILGNDNVGKTALIKALCNHQVLKVRQCGPTMSIFETVVIDRTAMFWEFGASEDPTEAVILRGAHSVIIAYDITDRDSFAIAISKWASKVGDLNMSKKVFLVGCKCDLIQNRKVDDYEGCQISSIEDWTFLETSSIVGNENNIPRLRSLILSLDPINNEISVETVVTKVPLIRDIWLFNNNRNAMLISKVNAHDSIEKNQDSEHYRQPTACSLNMTQVSKQSSKLNTKIKIISKKFSGQNHPSYMRTTISSIKKLNHSKDVKINQGKENDEIRLENEKENESHQNITNHSIEFIVSTNDGIRCMNIEHGKNIQRSTEEFLHQNFKIADELERKAMEQVITKEIQYANEQKDIINRREKARSNSRQILFHLDVYFSPLHSYTIHVVEGESVPQIVTRLKKSNHYYFKETDRDIIEKTLSRMNRRYQVMKGLRYPITNESCIDKVMIPTEKLFLYGTSIFE